MEVNVNFILPRHLYRSEAAKYCRESETDFEKICPFPPVRKKRNRPMWDKEDLDKWLTERFGKGQTDDDIISVL